MISGEIRQWLFIYRFEFFLITLSFNLFGILFFNDSFFNEYMFPIGFLFNIISGINLISNKRLRLLFIILFVISVLIFGYSVLLTKTININLLNFSLYFLFYSVIAYEIIRQIWFTKNINKDLIIGVISGYISLGLIGFFIFMSVEISMPGSFDSNLFSDTYTIAEKSDSLLYYSYITLMTIVYGEIVPVTTVAQKAAILLGLLGQFYLVIVTAVVVGKYINQKDNVSPE